VNYFTILSNLVEIRVFLRARTERGLDASRAAEPDRHLVAVNDHRHRASALAESQHPLQLRRVLFDVDVLERDLPPLKVVTGGLGIRSGVLAEDEDHAPLSHHPDRAACAPAVHPLSVDSQPNVLLIDI
jgi:hypothetical protein